MKLDSEALSNAIEAKMLTRKEVCIGAGVSPATLSRYLSTNPSANLRVVKKIAKYLKMNPSTIIQTKQERKEK